MAALIYVNINRLCALYAARGGGEHMQPHRPDQLSERETGAASNGDCLPTHIMKNLLT